MAKGTNFDFEAYLKEKGWVYNIKGCRYEKVIESSYYKGDVATCVIELVTRAHRPCVLISLDTGIIYKGKPPTNERYANVIMEHIALPCND